MKTLLIKDSSLGLASGHLASERLQAAAGQAGLTLVDSAADAELVLVIGQQVTDNAQLAGKSVALVDVQLSLIHI